MDRISLQHRAQLNLIGCGQRNGWLALASEEHRSTLELVADAARTRGLTVKEFKPTPARTTPSGATLRGGVAFLFYRSTPESEKLVDALGDGTWIPKSKEQKKALGALLGYLQPGWVPDRVLATFYVYFDRARELRPLVGQYVSRGRDLVPYAASMEAAINAGGDGDGNRAIVVVRVTEPGKPGTPAALPQQFSDV